MVIATTLANVERERERVLFNCRANNSVEQSSVLFVNTLDVLFASLLNVEIEERKKFCYAFFSLFCAKKEGELNDKI